MKTLFIPIKSQNLVHYYSTGLILPANYIENRAEDVQSLFTDKIILSKRKWTDRTDCSLEVVIHEIKPNNISENLFEITTPIPISRVRSIYFTDNEQKEVTIWNINNTTAFIPESIVKIEEKSADESVLDSEFNNIKLNNDAFNFNDKIKKFNSILGGLAFMRLGAKNPIMNYSENYFVVLSDINRLIERDLYRASNLLKADFTFNFKLKGILTGTKGWQVLLQHIQYNITKDYVKNLAKEKKVNLGERYILEFDKLDLNNADSRVIYYLSILATYGNGKSKKAEDLYYDFLHNKIKHNKEIVALLFGMHEGYKNIVFKINEKPVKFELNSKLDFYIVESVYQYVFNGIKENEQFKYIDTWCPIYKNKINEADFVTYQILDKKIILKKKIKPQSPEFLDQFYQKYMPQFFEQLRRKEELKLIDVEKLLEVINIKELLSSFQQTIINEINNSSKNDMVKGYNKIGTTQKIYTEAELNALKVKEILKILDDRKISYKKKKKKQHYIKLILDNQQNPPIFK